MSSLLACINLGSSTALNAINSLGGVSILTSYFITISCLVWRRLRGPPLPPRRWSLGRFGLAINVAALMFLTPVWFFAFWPLATPVTAENTELVLDDVRRHHHCRAYLLLREGEARVQWTCNTRKTGRLKSTATLLEGSVVCALTPDDFPHGRLCSGVVYAIIVCLWSKRSISITGSMRRTIVSMDSSCLYWYKLAFQAEHTRLPEFCPSRLPSNFEGEERFDNQVDFAAAPFV